MSDVPHADELQFGTDGWRDVIAERFTFANLRRAAGGYAEHLLAHGGKRALVGYDTRFLGRSFAMTAAAVLHEAGIETAVSASYLPTPALSFAVKHYGAAGGVMITASHNPYEYSGFKLKGAYGGSATSGVYQDVAARVARRTAGDGPGLRAPAAIPGVESFDVRDAYYEALAGLLDLELLAGGPLRLLHDPMGGAGAGWLTGFARHSGLDLTIEEIRGRPDPLFHGVNPEPIPANLEPVVGRMRSTAGAAAARFAACTDGDADRIGVVLPGGGYFNSHQIMAVLVEHLSARGGSGSVVKTFTVARVVERLARLRGLTVIETPVGFKHVVDELLKGNVLVGGEESGGIGVGGHVPERDGLANALLLLEAEVAAGLPLAEIFAGIERETGWRHAYDRRDVTLTDRRLLERVMAELAGPVAEFAGLRVAGIERLDGVKLNLEDGSWTLFRASGTEPLLRLYSEAADDAAVARNLGAAEALVQSA